MITAEVHGGEQGGIGWSAILMHDLEGYSGVVTTVNADGAFCAQPLVLDTDLDRSRCMLLEAVALLTGGDQGLYFDNACFDQPVSPCPPRVQ